MTQEENKAVIRAFVEEVINQGQLGRADDLVAVDFVEVDPLPDRQQGCEGLKQVIDVFRTAFPDIHWVIDEMVGEGEKVFSRFTWQGTHRGEFFGVPATGKHLRITPNSLWLVAFAADIQASLNSALALPKVLQVSFSIVVRVPMLPVWMNCESCLLQ